MEDLDCVIFTEARRDTLVKLFNTLSFKEDNGGFYKNENEIIIYKNYDRNSKKRSEFPDGFESFQLYMEISIEKPEKTNIEEQVLFISSLLKELWDRGIPAVASCEYEHLLLNNGGYKSKEIPWPKSETT